MGNEKLFVENYYGNIVVVNPNKVYNQLKEVEDRNVAQENLVIYANLQCSLQPRSRLIKGEDFQELQTIASSRLNFLNPNNQDYFSTNWTDLQSQHANPNVINSELLGITNISYKCGASFIPTVDITLEDIRGRSLFESGDESIYSVFVNLPYPTFYLTLKGFYGKAIKYPLILQKFQASFDQSSGNFLITLNFLGYKYNVLTDIQEAYVRALPNMYAREITQNLDTQTVDSTPTEVSVSQINGSDVATNTQIIYRGYETLKSVYDLYIQKKLLPEGFPYLTIQQLISKLENFEKKLLTSLGNVSLEQLTDAKEFDKILNDFSGKIDSYSSTPSWKNKFLDTKNFYLIQDTDGVYRKIYTYKAEYLTALKVDEVTSDLNTILKEGIDKLDNAATFGRLKGGNYSIQTRMDSGFVIPSPYIQPDTIRAFTKEIAKKRTGKENPSEEVTKIDTDLTKLSDAYSTIITERQNLIASGKLKAITPDFPLFFRLEGEKYFLGEIDRLKKVLEVAVNVIQGDLTQEINLLLQRPDGGIGFNPTIRNIIGVIMASTDAFLRLMDEVHLKAFDSRNNPRKKRAVVDDVGNFPDSPVFPWPQFNLQEFAEDGKITYDLKYPGDPKYVSLTAGDDYNAWPEVEFVEEFVKGYVLRDQQPLEAEVNSPDSSVTRLLIGGFDILQNTAYSTNQYVSFLYEIWERYIAISQYEGFQRQGDAGFGSILNFLAAFEASNLIKGIGSDNPDLIVLLKQINFTPTTYEEYLKEISSSGVNVAWQKYIAGQYYTDYLASEIESANKIIIGELPNVDATISTESNASDVEKEMEKYLKRDDKNVEYYTDTFPYVFPSWNSATLEDTELSKVLRTSSTIYYNQDIKKLVNWEGGKPNNNKIRPFTFFPIFTTPINYNEVETDIKAFYELRYSSEKVAYTEKTIYNNSSLIEYKTTSIINTQAFVNAIVDGVTKERNNVPFAYKQASYLFLNSLPLSNLFEKYIDDDGRKRNYIGVSLKKYGAIHNLPKLWVARIGSLWHRYKEYVQTGFDFVSGCTQPFNFNLNYDPVGSDPNKTYKFLSGTTPFNITFKDPQLIGFPPTATTINVLNQGFYPNLLNDFFYFLNGENLYQNNNTIQVDIQQKINLGEVELFTNSDSQIVKMPMNTNNITQGLVSVPYSVLFRDKNYSEDGKTYYFTAPSFGSIYNQGESECFDGPNQVVDYFNNTSVYNGSIRMAWGLPNFGYIEDILQIASPLLYPFGANSETRNGGFTDFNPYDNNAISSTSYYYIDEIFGVFTKEELDTFELEFLNFSQQSDNVTGTSNLQEILKKSLRLEEADVVGSETNARLKNIQLKQYDNFNSYINKLINENYLYQRGNPTGLNFRDLSYFSSNPKNLLSGTIDLYTAKTPNTLPSANAFITVAQSKQLKPQEWIALETYVGIINIDGMSYTDTGSTITDFFIDLNVAFTVENIQRFAQIIKIYATKKITQGVNVASFKTLTDQFFNDCNTLRNNIFTNAFPKIRKALPNTSISSVNNVDTSATEGGLTKLEYYNLFKAINDKWVAGNNYNNETLFEDILFLDRANRDVGDKVIVDIFKVVDYLKNNPKRNIYTVITSIGQDNNFVNFSIPAYINFYNVQKVGKTAPSGESEDPTTIAEKLFGTFTEVDYQDSQTKLIFQYTELPSEQLKNPSQINGFNDDSFNLGVPTNNPLYDDTNKTDAQKALSNKVVGFAVDFGSQNQGVFQNVQVSQDLGKATSESLQMEFDAANTLRGTRSYTQSVGLYNIYKSRSYSSTVTAFGNVMIQPTMYFVLRNVPLFAGPYFITEVEHTISGMDFKTKLVGTRQRIYTPPIDNPLLGTIKKNLLGKLVNRLVTKRQNDKKVAATTQAYRDTLATSLVSTSKPDLSSNCKTTATYASFTKTNATKTSESSNNIWGTIYNSYGTSGSSVYMIYTLFYLESYNGSNFTFYNNNLLKTPIGVNTPSYGGYALSAFNPEYICLKDDNNVSEAYATFKNVQDCVNFAYNRYNAIFNEVLKNVDNETLFVSGFTKTWIEKVPYDKVAKNKAPELYDSFLTTYPDQFADLELKVKRSYTQVRKFLGL